MATCEPYIICPEPATIDCSNQEAINNWLADYSFEDCGGAGTVNVSGYDEQTCEMVNVIFDLVIAGNTEATCSAALTIVDETNPFWTNEPMDMSVECNGSGNATALNNWLTSFSGMDACGTATVTHNYGTGTGQVSLSDGCGATGSVTVTFTLSDDCGHSITKDATFTIQDMTNPGITCPVATLTIECGASLDPLVNAALSAWLGSATASDVCGTASITSNTYSPTGFTDGCGATGSQTVTFTATDACNRTNTCMATVQIVDTTDPEINCPSSTLEIECGTSLDPDDNGALLDWLNSATTTDVCGTASITGNNYSETGFTGDCGATGSQTVTFTATDACNRTNTCTATVQIVDTTNPAITCPAAPLTIECGASLDPDDNADLAAWLNSAEGMDDCSDVTITTSYSQTGFTNGCGATGSQTVTFTATDACNRTSTCTADINIVDTVDPEWTDMPEDKTVECSAGNANALANWLASFNGTDACGTATVTHNYGTGTGQVSLSDGCGATGSVMVTFTLTDECDNSITKDATFKIEDTTIPVISACPGDMTIECNDTADPLINTNLGMPTGSDNCGTVSFTYEDSKVNCEITRTWTATDECGLKNDPVGNACVQTIHVNYSADPIGVTCPAAKTIECGDPMSPAALGTATSTGGCSDIAITYNDVLTTDGCGNSGIYTRTWTAEDMCGYKATCDQIITVNDTKGPAITCPNGATVDCGDDATTDVTGVALAEDLCGTAEVAFSDAFSTDVNGDCVILRTWTATDECSNPNSCVQTITISDKEAPDPVCPAGADNLTCVDDVPCPDDEDFIAGLIDYIEENSTDNCKHLTASLAGSKGWACSDEDNDGTYTFGITFTFDVMDECGNTASCTVTYSGLCQPICTYTQGAWGNKGGAPASNVNDPSIQDDEDLIDALLAANGGVLTIGSGGHMLNITSGFCVLELVPSSGGGAILAPTCTTCTSCAGNNPTKKKKLQNNLATQVIALQLNVWYNEAYNNISEEAMLDNTLACLNIAANLVFCDAGGICKLRVVEGDVNHDYDYTIGGLLELANDFLGNKFTGLSSAQAKQLAGALTGAVGSVNEFWDECANKAPCGGISSGDTGSKPLITGNTTFEAYPSSQKVNMHWIVPDNKEIDHFTIQHSTDGETFKLLSERTTAPGVDWKLYELTDEWPADGANYYRLTVYKQNGEVEVMPDKLVFFTKPPVFGLIPNPATNEVFFNIELLRRQNVTITIFNTMGQQVFLRNIEEVTKAYERIDLSDIGDGFYIVSVKVGDEVYSTKLVVRK